MTDIEVSEALKAWSEVVPSLEGFIPSGQTFELISRALLALSKELRK